MPNPINRRAIAERPLAKLTDEELHAIDRLSSLTSVLESELADTLQDLGYLATSEMSERDLKAALDA